MYGNSTSAYETICPVVGRVMAHPYHTIRTTRNGLFSLPKVTSECESPDFNHGEQSNLNCANEKVKNHHFRKNKSNKLKTKFVDKIYRKLKLR